MNIYSTVSEYWNTAVSNWKIASNLDVGSEAFYKEVERYRFEKLDYLPVLVDYGAYTNKTVLDVGCGLGTDLSRFAEGQAQVTGIDISPDAINLAKTNFKQRGHHGDFIVMNGEAMSFNDDHFDFVYCHTVLHFTPKPEKMIQEIHRILKPGGSALLMTINRHSWLYFLHKLAGLKIDYLDAPVFHRFNYTEFDHMLSPFEQRRLLVERFPRTTEVHKGWKAHLYNSLFVRPYNALPKKLINKTGYHLLAFVTKES